MRKKKKAPTCLFEQKTRLPRQPCTLLQNIFKQGEWCLAIVNEVVTGLLDGAGVEVELLAVEVVAGYSKEVAIGLLAGVGVKVVLLAVKVAR